MLLRSSTENCLIYLTQVATYKNAIALEQVKAVINEAHLIINPRSVTAWMHFGSRQEIILKPVSTFFLIKPIKNSSQPGLFLLEFDFLWTDNSIFSASLSKSSSR